MFSCPDCQLTAANVDEWLAHLPCERPDTLNVSISLDGATWRGQAFRAGFDSDGMTVYEVRVAPEALPGLLSSLTRAQITVDVLPARSSLAFHVI